MLLWLRYFLGLVLANALATIPIYADQSSINPNLNRHRQALIPPAPEVSANAYILMDAHSGRVLASKNSDKQVEPASLTKMMTMYVVSGYLGDKQLSLDDKVRVSKKAWRTGGSKLFIKHGHYVPVSTLIKGVIIVSGNDASIALAEHVAGSEKSFVSLMNSTAQQLGMQATHYENVTGLPQKGHTTSVHDLAILGQALVHDYPQEYHWYKEKWLTYNGIKQSNRNRLLWRDENVDGIKTGHTDSAGFCLVSSAKRDGMRLISVVVGEPSDNARTEDSQSLLTWGFRFFESHRLLEANKPLYQARAWLGKQSMVAMGSTTPVAVTTPKGQWQHVHTEFVMDKHFEAPIHAGQAYGKIIVKDEQNKILATYPLVALESVDKAGLFTRFIDRILMFFHNLFG